MQLHVGDVFEIRKRYDTGGFKFIRVERVHGLAVYVRDLDSTGKPIAELRERAFHRIGIPARNRLRKYWKRARMGEIDGR